MLLLLAFLSILWGCSPVIGQNEVNYEEIGKMISELNTAYHRKDALKIHRLSFDIARATTSSNVSSLSFMGIASDKNGHHAQFGFATVWDGTSVSIPVSLGALSGEPVILQDEFKHFGGKILAVNMPDELYQMIPKLSQGAPVVAGYSNVRRFDAVDRSLGIYSKVDACAKFAELKIAEMFIPSNVVVIVPGQVWCDVPGVYLGAMSHRKLPSGKSVILGLKGAVGDGQLIGAESELSDFQSELTLEEWAVLSMKVAEAPKVENVKAPKKPAPSLMDF